MPQNNTLSRRKKTTNSFGRQAMRQLLLGLLLLAMGFGLGVAATSASNLYRMELNALRSGGDPSAPASFAR